jgi:hypothetical protein
MGQLRDRMEADLRLRGLSANTRRLYLRCARDPYMRLRRGTLGSRRGRREPGARV